MLQSSLTGEMFDEKDCVRILNPRQASFYWGEKGIKPYSIYPSKDLRTGEPIIVFLFSRSKTQESYEEWQQRKQ